VGTKHVTQYGVLGRTLTWLMWHRRAGNNQGKSHLRLYLRWLAVTQYMKQHIQICWSPRLRRRKYKNTMKISCIIKCKTVNTESLLQFSTLHKDTPVHIFYIYYRFLHQLLNITSNKNPTRCNSMQSDLFYCKITLHVSGVTAPIIRSTKNCNRSLRYRS